MLQKEEAVVQVAEEHARDENGAVGINLISSYPLLACSLARGERRKLQLIFWGGRRVSGNIFWWKYRFKLLWITSDLALEL